MAKKNEIPKEPARTALIVPLDHARNELANQLKKGTELLSTPTSSPQALEQIETDTKIWRDRTIRLLLNFFNTREPADDFTGVVGSPSFRMSGNDPVRAIQYFHHVLKNHLVRLDSIYQNLDVYPQVLPVPVTPTDQNPITPNPKSKDPHLVFVVHGRNIAILRSMMSFLRSIGLTPLEWPQAVSSTEKTLPYIGEILDNVFSTAQAIVVLFTPDDEARLREPLRNPTDASYESELIPQARPNVLFEAGMALGILPKGTIFVQVGELRPFSDIGGRYVVKLDNSTEKRQDFAMRLQTAGCPVNLSGTDWHGEGDFSIGF